MLALRKTHQTLVYGDYKEYLNQHPSLYIYQRFDEKSKYVVVLNFSENKYPLQYITGLINADLLISNYQHSSPDELAAWEARIYYLHNI